MKPILFTIVFFLLLNLGLPQAFAETSVDIENNGNGALSNVHINNNVGQNTTNNSTTVCINGNCSTSQDGNVDRQEGGASVKIENSTNSNTPQPSASPTPLRQGSEGQTQTITPTPTHEASHSASFDKTQDKHTKQNQGNKSPQTGLEQIFANIQNFINQLFSIHK